MEPTPPNGTYVIHGTGHCITAVPAKDQPCFIAGILNFTPDMNVSGMAIMPNADGEVRGTWKIQGGTILITMGVAGIEQLEIRAYFDPSGNYGTFARRHPTGRYLSGTMMRAAM